MHILRSHSRVTKVVARLRSADAAPVHRAPQDLVREVLDVVVAGGWSSRAAFWMTSRSHAMRSCTTYTSESGPPSQRRRRHEDVPAAHDTVFEVLKQAKPAERLALGAPEAGHAAARHLRQPHGHQS